MATLRQIKEQQQSVSTINKITKAMKLVSSAKSQKAVNNMKQYKEYFGKIKEIMAELIDKETTLEENKNTYWILIFSDLGLAGGYNSSILKEINNNIKSNDSIFIIGNKGINFFKKNKSNSEFMPLSSINDDSTFLSQLTSRIKGKYYDENKKVKIIYTEYKSQVDFKPVVKTILPIQKIELDKKVDVKSEENKLKAIIEFEPSKEELLKQLETLYIQAYLVDVYRESQASEHTSRKNAMENATTNGEELLSKLDIEYNRGRQSKITQEISEIIGGAESLK